MKYLPLVWAGLWRKRVRTVLTLLVRGRRVPAFGIMHGVTAGHRRHRQSDERHAAARSRAA